MLNNSLRLSVGLKGWQLLWRGKRGGGQRGKRDRDRVERREGGRREYCTVYSVHREGKEMDERAEKGRRQERERTERGQRDG